MFKIILLFFYTIGCYIFYPFEYLWNWIFAVKVNVKDKMMFTGESGGSGKSTLSTYISNKYGHNHISIDKCKYGENWIRYPVEVFVKNINESINNSHNGKYVIDGVYSDRKTFNQQKEMDALMDIVDVVVWNEQPKYISILKKLFRSYKRYIGAVEQGASPEKLSDVIATSKNTWNNYDIQYKLLNDRWLRTSNDKTSDDKYKRVKWPWFFEC
jgi:adenylate kinase family enzyme